MRITYKCKDCATKCELSLENTIDNGWCPVDQMPVNWIASDNEHIVSSKLKDIIITRQSLLIPHLESPYVKNTFELGFNAALEWILGLNHE